MLKVIPEPELPIITTYEPHTAVMDDSVVPARLQSPIEVAIKTANDLRNQWSCNKIFLATEDYDIVALFPIGYAADDAKPSPRHEDRRSKDEAVTIL